VISLRVGHEEAVAFIEKLKSPESGFEIKWVDTDIEDVAIEIFKKQTSKNTSFVDCTNMVFLERLHADAIFSFDEVYKKNGFQMIESL
jgi:predicted nucleic acid-binding protein